MAGRPRVVATAEQCGELRAGRVCSVAKLESAMSRLLKPVHVVSGAPTRHGIRAGARSAASRNSSTPQATNGHEIATRLSCSGSAAHDFLGKLPQVINEALPYGGK